MRQYLKVIKVVLPLLFGGIVRSSASCALVPLPVNGGLLENVRQAYIRGDKATVRRVGDMAAYSERFLNARPVTVTDKKRTAPSNDPRDYVSLSPYWWPDSTKTGGLPYVRHDGKRNPEVYEYANREQANLMGTCVDFTSVLYYITGDRRYAQACAAQLRAWFTDAKTGINPNMTYAQIIPGRTTLRGTGIIDSRRFVRAILMSQLIEGSEEWTEADRRQLRAWAEAFCYWLENSTQGRKESAAANNHGLWYDAVHIMLLAYLDRKADVEKAVDHGIMAKLEAQIAPDGSLPQELKRTLSLHYSTFVMEALTLTANVVRPLGINLWLKTTAKGTGMQDVASYLLPFYLHPEAWPYKQIKPFAKERGAVIMYEAAMSAGREDYLRTAGKIGVGEKADNIDTVIYGIMN